MILNLSATVEASVDFSEDVGSIDEEDIKDRVKELVNSVELHMDDSNAGERLRDGVQVCILGKPNVGKSTLLNTLCRRPAAIVSPIAGTTRDTIEQYLDIGGFPIKIIDTAGIRDANEADTIELEGIKRAENVAKSSDLIIIVVDSSEIPTNAEIHEWCRKSEQNLTLKSDRTAMKILVLNKCDLLSNTDFEYTKERLVDIENIILMSCVTGKGFDQFINILRDSVQNLCLRDEGTSFSLIVYQNITKIKVYGGRNEECDGKMCTFTNRLTKSWDKDEILSLGIRNKEAKTTEINIVGIQFNDEIICGSPINLATTATNTTTPTTTPTTTSTTTTGMIFLLGTSRIGTLEFRIDDSSEKKYW
mgnify:CR=1 FL=1